MTDSEVLEAVIRVISRLGPTRLTLADVAAEAGLAAPTLLQRFGSKRGLLLAVAERGPEGVERAFAESRARCSAPLEALRAALVALTAPVRTREALANHLAFLQLDLSDDAFHRHALAHGRALRREIGTLLEEAVCRGELPRIDAERGARAVQTVYNGALVTWAIHGEGTVEAAVREAVDILLERLGETRARRPSGID